MNTTERLKTITKHILDFCVRNVGIWVFFLLIISISSLFTPRENGTVGIGESRFLLSVALSGLSASVLATIFSLLRRRRSYLLKGLAMLLLGFCALICLADIWLTNIIFTRWSDRILAMIFGTSAGETSEFLTVYVTGYGLAIVIAGILLMYAAGDIILILSRRIRPWLMSFVGKYPYISLSLVFLINFLSVFDIPALAEGENPIKIKFNNSVLFFGRAVMYYTESFSEIRDLEKVIPEATGQMRDSLNTPAKILWIIGESDNRSHHPLYGYDKNTTPNLKEEYENGNILKYDVTGYLPATGNMMSIIYSLHNITEKNTKYSEYPIVTMILRNAGYKVRLHDNQSTLSTGAQMYELGTMTFLNSPRLKEASLDYRNNVVDFYDYNFVKKEGTDFLRDTLRRSIEIYHLYGQHFRAFNRYPAEETVFKASDYNNRAFNGVPLKNESKEYLAHYDNALHYVDKSIGWLIENVRDEDAIIIYHPDHGEEVFDYRDFRGRPLNYGNLPGTMEALLHLPFYIYTTPKYRERHPQQYERLKKATTRRLSLLYMSHFLLDVANVQSKWYRPQLSPLSDKWSNPPRIVNDGLENEYNFDTKRKLRPQR